MKKFLNTLSEASESDRTGAAVRKDFTTTVSKGAGPNTMVFQASTAAPDRYGDIVVQSGWKLDNYRRNPVICWAHDYSQPSIGRAVSLDTNSRGLTVEVEFAPTPFAQSIRELCAGGFLKAVSVGFSADEYERNSDGGTTYTSMELLEISLCPIPANAEALRLRSLAGSDTPLTEAEFGLLLDATDKVLTDFERRVFPEPEYITEADFKVMLNAANKLIDDFVTKHTGKLPD